MLRTEMRNPKTLNIDKMDTLTQMQIMSEENFNAVRAVEAQLPQIAKAADAITEAFKNGGRLFYIGAGTSGRLGVLDASECPPTFGVDHSMVTGIIAGGDSALRKASENAEDDPEAGKKDLISHGISGKDVVVGISAAGGARYVLNALSFAKELGCVTVGISSNEGSPLDLLADISVCTDTGPEVITGSTRMKAGTAQKLVLNMLSTAAMINSGYVYENMMINLRPTNIKLKNRMVGIVCEIIGCTAETAAYLLEKGEWSIPKALEIHRHGSSDGN